MKFEERLNPRQEEVMTTNPQKEAKTNESVDFFDQFEKKILRSQEARKAFLRGGVEFVTEIHENKIDTIVIMDTSARPLGIFFLKLFRRLYPEENPPKIKFIISNKGLDPEDLKLAFGDSCDDFENKRVLLVDECVDSGDTIFNAKKKFEQAFPKMNSVITGAMSGNQENIDIKPPSEAGLEYLLHGSFRVVIPYSKFIEILRKFPFDFNSEVKTNTNKKMIEIKDAVDKLTSAEQEMSLYDYWKILQEYAEELEKLDKKWWLRDLLNYIFHKTNFPRGDIEAIKQACLLAAGRRENRSIAISMTEHLHLGHFLVKSRQSRRLVYKPDPQIQKPTILRRLMGEKSKIRHPVFAKSIKGSPPEESYQKALSSVASFETLDDYSVNFALSMAKIADELKDKKMATYFYNLAMNFKKLLSY